MAIYGPKELALWRFSPSGLQESLLAQDSSLEDLIPIALVQSMCDSAAALLDSCNWLRVFDARPRASLEDESSSSLEIESMEELAAQGWKISPGEEPHIGRRVKIRVEDEDDDVEGVVVAYLPPDDEEPMALWKVELSDGRRQDLEVQELHSALLGCSV